MLLAGFAPEVRADWPSWRGPEQTGMTREKAAVTTWSPEGENLLWRVPIGGRTTPIVMNGRLCFIGPVGEGLGLRERVICLDADNGRTLWDHHFNVFDTDVVESRVGWTSLVGDPETGNLYAHGSGGEFFCFDRDGKILWKVSMTETFGRVSGFGGRLHTPILDEDRVIVSFTASSWGDHAKPAHRYVAFDKSNGQVLWWAAPGNPPLDTTYSTPVVAVIDGVRMLIAGNADGWLYAMKARTGETLWKFHVSKLALNSSPVVDGNFVYIGHGEENVAGTEMGRVVCIDAAKRGDITETGEVWRFDACEIGYASPAVANGRLYVVDNSARLYCLDAKTGKEQWKFPLGRVGKGSPTVTADGIIYVGEENGIFHVLRDAGDRAESLDREEFTRPDRAIVEIYGSPAVVNGRVYFMTRYDTFCLGKRDAKPSPVVTPPMPLEKQAASKDPTFLQISPAEISLPPGGQATFTARFFDSSGQLTRGGPVEWSVAGVKGAITSGGSFTAENMSGFSAGAITAKSAGLEAKSRVRIHPLLPIAETFDAMPEDSVPPGWVGVTRKTKIVSHDGSLALKKLAEDPSAPFMRIKAYMSPPIAGGYTIEADLYGTPKGERFRPEMGVINSRYFLFLMGPESGEKPRLRLESWMPIPRLRHDIPFEWETNRWYRMKFQVIVEGEKALLRGKVWPRDSAEPGAWTTEFTDPYPNREGSPGLYGYSPGTTFKSHGPEVFYDNIRVYKNDAK